MTKFDSSCFVGSWPFYHLENTSLSDIKKLHQHRGICGGVVSSLQAIFYNDPYEVEKKLSLELEGQSEYRHIAVVNPMLPGWKADLPELCEKGGIAGVRIVPGIHGYSLGCTELQELVDFLKANKLPLLINLRMEDPRATYIVIPRSITADETAAFLNNNPELTVLFCAIYPDEAMALGDIIRGRSNVFVDCSAIRGGLFIVEKMYEHGIIEKTVYGSMTPLFCMESSLMLIEQAKIPEQVKEMVFSENFKRVFN